MTIDLPPTVASVDASHLGAAAVSDQEKDGPGCCGCLQRGTLRNATQALLCERWPLAWPAICKSGLGPSAESGSWRIRPHASAYHQLDFLASRVYARCRADRGIRDRSDVSCRCVALAGFAGLVACGVVPVQSSPTASTWPFPRKPQWVQARLHSSQLSSRVLQSAEIIRSTWGPSGGSWPNAFLGSIGLTATERHIAIETFIFERCHEHHPTTTHAPVQAWPIAPQRPHLGKEFATPRWHDCAQRVAPRASRGRHLAAGTVVAVRGQAET